MMENVTKVMNDCISKPFQIEYLTKKLTPIPKKLKLIITTNSTKMTSMYYSNLI